MNIQSIIITDTIGVLILIILAVSSQFIRQRRMLSDRLFTAMCVLTASSCVGDLLAFLFDGVTGEGTYPALMFLNTFTYMTNICTSLLWSLYVTARLYGTKRHTIRVLKMLILPAAVGAVGLIVNLKWNFIFTIDEEHYYHRLTAAGYYFAVTYFYLFSSVFIRRHYRKRMGKLCFLPIWMFLSPRVCCTIAQFLVYGISLAWCSVAIGLVSIHMSLQNELSYLDPLTKLYNRNYLTYILNQSVHTKTEMRGIMLDMDKFKSINDNYGHAEGDAALIETANILMRAASEKAIPIRFAGDEFMMLLPKATEKELEETIENIRREEKVFNDAGSKPYKLIFSLGTSSFGGNTDLDVFLNEMDRKMYEQKRRKTEDTVR